MIANMMEVMVLHYIHYHGVKAVPSNPNSISANINTSILNAEIDTKLFQCLHTAEKKVYRDLQRLVFKSSG
jgi:hypothetical protein